jgi:hypothetical protein
MSTTRRTILSGALAAPFLAQFAGTAAGETTDETLGTVSGRWLEIRWTPQAKAQMDLFGATVEPIAPATWATDGGGRRVGLRFPIRSGTGDPSLYNRQAAHGSGQGEGGVVVRHLVSRFELTELRPTMADEVVSGAYKVNGVESNGQSLLRCDLSQGRVLAAPVPAGQPQTIQVEDVPVYATPESLEALTTALGPLALSTDTVLGHARSELVYTPPQP